MFGCVNRASDTLIDDLEKKDFYCRKICVSDELKQLYEVSFVEKCKKNVFSISCLTAPLCDLFVSELHLLLGLTGTHTRPGRMSLCAGVQFLL